MQTKRVAAVGLMAAAAGAGAWFLLGKKWAPARKTLGQKLKKTSQTVAEAVESVKQRAA